MMKTSESETTASSGEKSQGANNHGAMKQAETSRDKDSIKHVTSTTTTAPIKRGREHPRKHPLPETSVEKPKKKRGRPRKHHPPGLETNAAGANDAAAAVAPTIKKRGPGRPRKLPESATSEKPSSEPAPKKRGPGRPRKHPLPESATNSEKPKNKKKQGPGRPRKNPLPTETPASDKSLTKQQGPNNNKPMITNSKSTDAETVPTKKRGPVRPRKRPLQESDTDVPPKKRGPGRPRKHPPPDIRPSTLPTSSTSPTSSVEIKESGVLIDKPADQEFHKLVQERLASFVKASREEKECLANDVISLVQTKGGSFYEKQVNGTSVEWIQVKDHAKIVRATIMAFDAAASCDLTPKASSEDAAAAIVGTGEDTQSSARTSCSVM